MFSSNKNAEMKPICNSAVHVQRTVHVFKGIRASEDMKHDLSLTLKYQSSQLSINLKNRAKQFIISENIGIFKAGVPSHTSRMINANSST